MWKKDYIIRQNGVYVPHPSFTYTNIYQQVVHLAQRQIPFPDAISLLRASSAHSTSKPVHHVPA